MNINIKNKAYLVTLFKNFANAKRLDILYQLLDGELLVSEISKKTELSIEVVSLYLNKMRMAKIVSARQNGNNMYYKIRDNFARHILLSYKGINKSIEFQNK